MPQFCLQCTIFTRTWCVNIFSSINKNTLPVGHEGHLARLFQNESPLPEGFPCE